MPGSAFQIESFVSGIENNAYLVSEDGSDAGFIIDAPDSPYDLLSAIERKNVKIHSILITHGHWDHVMGLTVLLEKLNVPVLIGAGDAREVAKYKPPEVIEITEDVALNTGLTRPIVAKLTPGHTAGSVCYYLSGGAPQGEVADIFYISKSGKTKLPSGVLFSGDTLFPNGPGKTKTRDDFLQIVESLQTQVFSLPKDTTILPGHGASQLSVGTAIDEYHHFQDNQAGNEYGEVVWVKNYPKR